MDSLWDALSYDDVPEDVAEMFAAELGLDEYDNDEFDYDEDV